MARQIKKTSGRARRTPLLAAATTAAILVSGLAGTPASAATPATAKSPSVSAAAVSTSAQTWASLMYRSLGSGDEAVRLKALLASLQTAFAARVTDLTQARQQQGTAQAQLAAATTADATAQAAYATARTTLATAQKSLTTALKRRPASKTKIAEARQRVTTATADRQLRSAAAGRTAATLRTAQAGARSATDALTAATTAWQTANVGLRNTQQKLIGLPKFDAALAAQAAAISKAVVTDTRAKFTVADTAQVNGITINKTVAYAFGRMIQDAAKDGIQLSGGGFRTKQQQIQLRVTNGCPDIWTAPSSSCKVPTAIPGRSLHELGLAVDITTGGSTIKDRNSAAFKWLAAHAARYGFVNLPSEPWHWSITGN